MFIALVPAYNEEKTIGSVVGSLLGYVDEVVVIDDGSRDMTIDRAIEAGATVLVHNINRGQGAALETGHQYARDNQADMVIHFDADGQFDPKEITEARIALQESGADILFGSRFLQKKSSIPFFKKNVLLPIARLVDGVFGSLKLSDAHNGFRMLTKHALSQIYISQDRMAHASEIPQIVLQKKLSYIEYPVTVIYHEYGQSASGGIKILKDLLIAKCIRK